MIFFYTSILYIIAYSLWTYTLDFQAWYGPAGVKSISALAAQHWDWSHYTYLVSWAVKLGFPIVTSLYICSFLSGLIVVCGVTKIAISQHRNAGFVGYFFALYSPCLWLSLLIGPDIIALAIMILALAQRDRLYIAVPLVLTSIWLKPIALPLLCFVPFIYKRYWLWIGSLPVLIFWQKLPVVLLLESVEVLIRRFSEFLDFWTLLLLASIIGFLGRKRFIHSVFICFVLACAGYIVFKMGEKIRPRYLISPMMVLLFYASLQICSFHSAFRKPLIVLGCVLLFCDSWAFFYYWKQRFVRNEGYEQTIPVPPLFHHHAYRSDLIHSDLSAKGAKSLHSLANSTLLGAGTVELRDTRHHHLIAPLKVGHKSSRILTPQNCCKAHESIQICAIRIVREFNQSGHLLVLPSTHGHRIKTSVQHWIQALEEQASAYPTFYKHDQWWNVLSPQYAQRSMPCKALEQQN